MSLNKNKAPVPNSSSFGIADEGTQMARLLGIVDIGIHSREYKGESKGDAQQLNFIFELPGDTIEVDGEERPRWIGMNRVNLVNGEKAKFTMIEKALDPNDTSEGDLKKWLGTECLLTIEHKHSDKHKKDYAVITAITGVPKGMAVAPLTGTPYFFDFEEPDAETYKALPDFVKEIIKEANNFGDIDDFVAMCDEDDDGPKTDPAKGKASEPSKDSGKFEEDEDDSPY